MKMNWYSLLLLAKAHPLVEHALDLARLRVPRPHVGLLPLRQPFGHPSDMLFAGLEVPLELGVLVLELHELVLKLLPVEAGRKSRSSSSPSPGADGRVPPLREAALQARRGAALLRDRPHG